MRRGVTARRPRWTKPKMEISSRAWTLMRQLKRNSHEGASRCSTRVQPPPLLTVPGWCGAYPIPTTASSTSERHRSAWLCLPSAKAVAYAAHAGEERKHDGRLTISGGWVQSVAATIACRGPLT